MVASRDLISTDFLHRRFNVKTLFIGIILLYSIMPIVSRLISSTVTTYAYMLLVIMTFLLLLFDKGINGALKDLKLLIPFLIYIVFTFFTNSESILLWGYQSLLFILPVLIGIYIKDKEEDYSKLLVFAFYVTAITTIIGCFRYHDAARVLATSASGQDEYAVLYSFQNIGGYTFVYESVLIYPYIIISFKRNKIHLFPALISTVLVLALCIISEYTTALLFAVATSLLYFVGRNVTVKKMFIILIFAIIAMIIFSNLLSNFLIYLAEHVSSENISERLLALANGITGLEASEDNRLEIYRNLFNHFLQRPLFGNALFADRYDAGHSFILQNLSDFGIVGGCVLVWMYHTVYKLFYKPYSKEKGYGFVALTFLIPILLSSINTGMWLTVSCIYGPILLKSIYKEKLE